MGYTSSQVSQMECTSSYINQGLSDGIHFLSGKSGVLGMGYTSSYIIQGCYGWDTLPPTKSGALEMVCTSCHLGLGSER